MVAKLPRVGDEFLDRYALERVVGFGGYGRIYQARQLDLNRRVALKIIAPPTAVDDEPSNLAHFAERFAREASAISKLSDPHTITMHDHGEHDGLLYMVLEFIDGKTIKDAIAAGGPMEPVRVVGILRQVLQSLKEAHRAGLIHRDIKPSNIMLYEHLGDPDCVKVLDFGLAKSLGDQQLIGEEDLTMADTLVGTPRYMSPEQVRHQPVTPATDLYSLGLLAIEMLTGEPVIADKTAMSIVARHISVTEFDVEQIECPEGLRQVIAGMVRKDPRQRLQSADEVLEGLNGWRAERRAAPWVPAVAVVVPLVVMGLIGLVSWSDRTAPPEANATPAVERRTVEPAVVVPVVEEPEPPSPPESPRNPAMFEAVVVARVRVGMARERSSATAEAPKPVRRRKTRKPEKVPDGERKLRIFEP